MSGGSFDYLYYKIENELIDTSVLSLLKSMVEWLDEPEQSQPEAAEELRKLYKYLESVLIETQRRVSPSLLEVIRGAEWWCSNDFGRDNFEKVWERHTIITTSEM